MFCLSRSLSTDGDFWNSAGLEAFISQQWRIHPADVGGKHVHIPFLILSSTHGNTYAFRINCHLQFQRRGFGNCCIWPSSRVVTGIKVPTCCFSLLAVLVCCAAAACKTMQWLPRKAVQGKDSNHRVYFFFTNRGEVKGTWPFFSYSWKVLLASNV